jgi:hypothetical protein
MFGNDLAAAVTMTRLNQYVEQRLSEKARPATVQRELACLRRAFRLGFQAGKVFRVPPFPSLTVCNAREVFFERDEFERLRSELPDDFIRPLITLAYWIGFRRGNFSSLNGDRSIWTREPSDSESARQRTRTGGSYTYRRRLSMRSAFGASERVS